MNLPWFNISAYSLAWPLGLSLIPLTLAILVYAYRRRGRGQTHRIGSTFLLKKFARPYVARSKFSPPWRFFFEVLISLLLILAISQLFMLDSSKEVAIVIDNSFSSFARLDSGKRIIDELKERASVYIRSAQHDSKFVIYTLSQNSKKLTPDPLYASRALSQLDEIEPTYSDDNIEVGLRKIALDRQYYSIQIFSDKAPASGALMRPSRIVAHSLDGVAVNNVAITNYNIPDSGPDKGKIVVEVRSFADHKVTATLILEGAMSFDDKAPLISAHTEEVNLDPHASHSYKFSQVVGAKASRVKLEFENLRSSDDSIAEDDVIYVAPEEVHSKVVLVGNIPAKELGLTSLQGFDIETLADPELIDGKLSNQPLFYIFHRRAPPNYSADMLVIMPETLDGSEQLARKNIEIADWNSTHALLNYLNLGTFSLNNGRVLKPPSWTETLIWSTQGPLMVAGQFENAKVIITGFDLLPFEGKHNPYASILLLNCIKWLSGVDATNSSAEFDNVSRLIGSGDSITRSKHEDSTEIPGIYIIDSQRDKKLKAINFFSVAESNLLKKQNYSLPELGLSDDPETGSTKKGLINLIAWIVLILLLVDLAIQSLSVSVALVRRGTS